MLKLDNEILANGPVSKIGIEVDRNLELFSGEDTVIQTVLHNAEMALTFWF